MGQNPVRVQDGDDASFVAAYALEEARLPGGQVGRQGLPLSRFDFHDVVHLIDQQADEFAAILHNQDAAVVSVQGFGQPQPLTEIDDGDDLPAQVHDSGNFGRAHSGAEFLELTPKGWDLIAAAMKE